MPTAILTAHLNPKELGQRYRATRCFFERSHLQIVRLIYIIFAADQRLTTPARPRADREAGAEGSVGTANALA
jgi:hypothetical protein